MQASTKHNNTFRRLSALSAALVLCAGAAFAQEAPAAPQPLKGADSYGMVVAPTGGAKLPSAVATPAVPTGAIVQAPTGSFITPLTPVPPASQEGSETSKDDASHQGIKVHGHWVIDVRNPDGTLAEHRDFQNSLFGMNQMVGLLYGSLVPADFVIYLSGSPSPCLTATLYCDLVHNLSVLPASARCVSGGDGCINGLTVTPASGAAPSLTLAGSMTATQAGSINLVGTFIGLCGGFGAPTTVSPATCATGSSQFGYAALTQASIASVPVAQGQVVSVTVIITFS